MKPIWLLLVLVLVLSPLAAPQNNRPAVSPNSSTTCSYTFTSGVGGNVTQFCVTGNGNITQFSRPAGFEHLNSGQVAEGYAICDLSTNTAYYDYAGGGDSGWGAPSVTSTTTSVQVIRTSTDGVWTLTQTIKQVKANNSGPGAASVSMALKNNSTTKRFTNIFRYADVNADGFPVNNFFNALDAVYGLDTSNYQGLAAINNTFNIGWGAYAQTVPSGPDPCNPTNAANQPFLGNGSLVLVWGGVLVGPGSTKTVAMSYKPM